jgi:hypothetical protein
LTGNKPTESPRYRLLSRVAVSKATDSYSHKNWVPAL